MDQSALLVPAPAAPEFHAWCAQFAQLHLDLGTGDAAFALRLARQQPELGVIGVDTCLDHVRVSPRRRPVNLALLRCDAAELPVALEGRINCIIINFPFANLLTGLINADDHLLTRLSTVLASDGTIEIRLNERALAVAGATLAAAEPVLRAACRRLDCDVVKTRQMGAAELRCFPSTWAKRIGFGREAAAIEVVGARRPLRRDALPVSRSPTRKRFAQAAR